MFRARIRIVLFSLFFVSPERDSLCFRIFVFPVFCWDVFTGFSVTIMFFTNEMIVGAKTIDIFFNIIVLGHYYDVSRKKIGFFIQISTQKGVEYDIN